MKKKIADKLMRVSIMAAALFIAANAVTAQPRIIPINPMTGDVEVIYGDPDKAGELFVIRIRELAGGIIPPHRHDVDEHITVVQGTLYFAVGEKFGRSALRELKTGSYAFIPKGSIMFGYTPGEAIVQVHGIGPFRVNWRSGDKWHYDLTTLDSPNAAEVFRFKRDDRVSTPRGKGKIKQGYDSGEVIGYDIEGDDGKLFMAEECEIAETERRPETKAGRRACFSRGEALTISKQRHAGH
jgi:quercetin dioxygenase-like cupin family protein